MYGRQKLQRSQAISSVHAIDFVRDKGSFSSLLLEGFVTYIYRRWTVANLLVFLA
jgi:hypothetical protein